MFLFFLYVPQDPSLGSSGRASSLVPAPCRSRVFSLPLMMSMSLRLCTWSKSVRDTAVYCVWKVGIDGADDEGGVLYDHENIEMSWICSAHHVQAMP